MKPNKTVLATISNEKGEVFEHPDFLLAGMNGTKIVRPEHDELIPLPEGSRLFTIPGSAPIGFSRSVGRQEKLTRLPHGTGRERTQAVAAFLTPGYTRTLLPAADYRKKRVTLPLWSYTAVGWCVEEQRFYVSAVQVDRNRQWQPHHFDDRKLAPLVRDAVQKNPENRLLIQLSRCALDYHCFAAKNLFFKRWEAPLPTSPACNSRCIGCISLQESDCCPASQERLNFVPSVDEICQVAVPHLCNAENAIVSFGQGCEGDPILQADLVAEAVRVMRSQTKMGTINFNSNASIPGAIDKLAKVGIDSIRVSLNSVREPVYNAYYRPDGYQFAEVLESLRIAKREGLYTMLNYLVFPGVNDQTEEIKVLSDLIDEIGIDMIQLRNLSIDPNLYLSILNSSGGVGILSMLKQIKADFPHLQFGYFNRTREMFFPSGYESDWPISADLGD